MAIMEHFEIPADDLERAQTFYAKVLGFHYDAWGEDMGMLRQPEDKGVGGSLYQRGEVKHPTLVFTVENLDEALALVAEHGGEQLGEIQPMGESRWVHVRDSEGNTIGLFQN